MRRTSTNTSTTKGTIDVYPYEAHLEIRGLVGDASTYVYRCERPLANHLDHSLYECLGQTRHPSSLSDPTACLRSPLLLGPGVSLDPSVSRPSFTSNAFCLSCHDDSNLEPTMQVTAALSAGTVKSSLDARRQPLQPRPRLFGVIPQNYIEVGNPSMLWRTDLGLLVDHLLDDPPSETEN